MLYQVGGNGTAWATGITYPAISANIGDMIFFQYTTSHNVYKFLNLAAYTACDFSTATMEAIIGPYTYTITSLPAYFGCQIAGHCFLGMKVAVNQAGSTAASSTAAATSSSSGLSTGVNSAFGVADIASASHYLIVTSVLGHLLLCLI